MVHVMVVFVRRWEDGGIELVCGFSGITSSFFPIQNCWVGVGVRGHRKAAGKEGIMWEGGRECDMLEAVWRFRYGEPARPTRYWHDMLTRYRSSGRRTSALGGKSDFTNSLNFETPTYHINFQHSLQIRNRSRHQCNGNR